MKQDLQALTLQRHHPLQHIPHHNPMSLRSQPSPWPPSRPFRTRNRHPKFRRTSTDDDSRGRERELVRKDNFEERLQGRGYGEELGDFSALLEGVGYVAGDVSGRGVTEEDTEHGLGVAVSLGVGCISADEYYDRA